LAQPIVSIHDPCPRECCIPMKKNPMAVGVGLPRPASKCCESAPSLVRERRQYLLLNRVRVAIGARVNQTDYPSSQDGHRSRWAIVARKVVLTHLSSGANSSDSTPEKSRKNSLNSRGFPTDDVSARTLRRPWCRHSPMVSCFTPCQTERSMRAFHAG